MNTQIIHTSEGEVEFSLIGTGIPILIIHGGHSSSNEKLFHKGYDTKRFCLITPSRPGYGNTPLSNNGSPKRTAALIVSILDELNLTSAVVVGISAGGPSAIEIASNYPDKVTKLILISAVSKKWLTENDRTYIKAKKIFSPKVEKYSWGLFRTLYSWFPNLMAKTMFKELSNFQPDNVTKNEVEELFSMIKLQRSKQGFINDLDQTMDPNTIDKITCPTLILHSSNDITVNIEHAKYAHAKIKNSILKVYNNRWGHLLWLGQESDNPIKDTIQFIDNKSAV